MKDDQPINITQTNLCDIVFILPLPHWWNLALDIVIESVTLVKLQSYKSSTNASLKN